MINNSLQGSLQEAIRSALGCANTFEGDLHALCDLYGVANGHQDARLIGAAQKHDSMIGTASGALNYFLLNPSVLPTFGLNFVDGTDTLDSRVTFTRASSGTRFNSSGVLVTASNNQPRFDYDPITLAIRGLLIEEQRTNSIRNSTMVGAVAGTPGSLPTNWVTFGTLGTLTRQVVGTGTANGIPYIDLRFSGTTSSTNVGVGFETLGAVAASNGQTWNQSAFVSLVGGTLSNVSSVGLQMRGNDASTTVQFLGQTFTPDATLSRQNFAGTLSNATIASIHCGVIVNFASGAVIDLTLRIGLPQLELGAFATSPIPTTTAAATRAADVATINPLGLWFNTSVGTLLAEIDTASFSNFPAIATFHDGTNNNALTMLIGSTGLGRLGGSVGGVAWTNLSTINATTINTTTKYAVSWAAGDQAVCLNGGTMASGTNATVPTVTAMTLSASRTGAAASLNGHARRLAYYPTRLPNSTLQALTA